MDKTTYDGGAKAAVQTIRTECKLLATLLNANRRPRVYRHHRFFRRSRHAMSLANKCFMGKNKASANVRATKRRLDALLSLQRCIVRAAEECTAELAANRIDTVALSLACVSVLSRLGCCVVRIVVGIAGREFAARLWPAVLVDCAVSASFTTGGPSLVAAIGPDEPKETVAEDTNNRSGSVRFAKGCSHLVFLGSELGKLIPYDGPFEDSRLKSYHTYQLVSAVSTSDASWQELPLLQPQLQNLLSQALLPGVRWKAQVGFDIVYFGCPKGLNVNIEASLTSGAVDTAVLEEALNEPKRTSFASLTFPEIAAVVGCIRQHHSVVKEKVQFTLRATEKALRGGKQIFYERSAATREAVLDGAPFTVEAFHDEQRCANFVFVPPSPQKPGASPPLVRCQAVGPTQSAGCFRRLQVKVSDGKVSLRILDDNAFVNYARVEESHVLTLEESAAEIHVTKVEEYGSVVAEKENPVRVDMRFVNQQGSAEHRQGLWESFVRKSFSLCVLLAQFRARNTYAAKIPATPQVFCLGDSATAPCADPFCRLRHSFSMCLLDAFEGCYDGQCVYWHAFTEVQRLLKEVKADCLLDRCNFRALRVKPQSVARLRAALSLQLLRIRDAATRQMMQEAARNDDGFMSASLEGGRLAEAVKQYNAIAHSFHEKMAADLTFYHRCCHRLKSALPLLAARDEVKGAWLRGETCILLNSSAGSGKSTQVPQYLAECAAEQLKYDRAGGIPTDRQKLVICVEPRALAAASLADYVALEYDDPAVSTERRVQSLTDPPYLISNDSHIVYTTPRAFLRMMQGGQINLANNVFAVMVDEAHQRTVEGDMLLGVLKAEMRRTKRAFQLVVCSATLQMEVFRAYFSNARYITVKSRFHPVEIVYAGDHDTLRHGADYVQETVKAVISVIEDPPSIRCSSDTSICPGRHILAFLPAAADTEAARASLSSYIANQMESGSSPTDANRRASKRWKAVRVCTISNRQLLPEQLEAIADVEPDVRKVIFATPLAETSITIDGVGYVIDCGLSQISRYDSVRHLTEMVTSPVTQSCALHRAGRAGRTGPGICIRLYTRASFNLFEKENTPAVKRASLHTVALRLIRMHYSVLSFDWIDKPDQKAVEATLDELVLHHALKPLEPNNASMVEEVRPALSAFGLFLSEIDGIPVPLGKLLYEASKRGNVEFIALSALAAAVIQCFKDLFAVARGAAEEFFAMLREYGRRNDAASRGDVLCATRLVAAAFRSQQGLHADDSGEALTSSELAFLQPHVLENIAMLQRLYFCNTSFQSGFDTGDVQVPSVPTVSPTVVDLHAVALQRLLARCFCLQVAVRVDADGTRYQTVGATLQECLLTDRSFLKQQYLMLKTKGDTHQETLTQFGSHGFPEFYVFSSFFLGSPTGPGTISLCTPVKLEWLPIALQEEITQMRLKRSAVGKSVWSVALPSVLRNEWRPQEVSMWLSRKVGVTPYTIAVDYAPNQLSLYCERGVLERATAALSEAIDHARQRHAQTCYEVALNGFCRVTWRNKCEEGEVLHDKDEYVTLQFSGACETAISCLDLDLAEMVEDWSDRWFGRRMLVTVRSGDGGASPASGRWTALITFANSRDAHGFYERYESADEAERPSVLIEPYCEQEPLAPSVDSTVPLRCVSLRLYVGHCDPEGNNTSVGGTSCFPVQQVVEFQRQVCAALPDVVTASQQVDISQGLLYLQFLAVNDEAAHSVLAVLHRIRGPSIHFRSLFFDVAYSVEFPLPSLVSKQLQDLLQDAVTSAANDDSESVTSSFHCESLYTHGNRCLLLRCTRTAQLQRALRFLRDATMVTASRLPETTREQKTYRALVVALQSRYLVSCVRAQQNCTKSLLSEYQLQFREVDGTLYFIGPKKSYTQMQKLIDQCKFFDKLACTTLTLPPQFEPARNCARWVDQLVGRCQSNNEPVRVIRQRNTIIFLAPATVVEQAKHDPQVAHLWRAIDEEENELYDPCRGSIEGQRVDAAAVADGTADADETGNDCALCFRALHVDNVQLLCGHHFCTECLAGVFNAEGGAAPEPPIKCTQCGSPILTEELRLFAPTTGLKRLGELVRSRLIAEADRKHVEMKACPNKVCLGIPKVVAYDKRRCSGCDLAFCEVCVCNGKVRPWHEGRHYSATDVLADKLIQQLPLLPKCPHCGQPFYNFDGCFAVKCSHGHAFCGFCMKDCGRDAHLHARVCARNPQRGSYFSSGETFYQCRSEDLAAQLKNILLNHPAGSPQLVEFLCSKVKGSMSDDWPKGPIEAAEAELMAHKWDLKPPTEASRLPPVEPKFENTNNNISKKSIKASAVDDARRLVSSFEDAASFGISALSDDEVDSSDFAATVASLQDMGVVDLRDFVEEALGSMKSVEKAAVLLYAVYDVDGKIEVALRSLGREYQALPALSLFFRILLRGIQLLHTSVPIEVKRTAHLTAGQLALYKAGGMIVWDTPTRCNPIVTQSLTKAEESGGIEFRVKCSTYACVSFCEGGTLVRYILPAGARLRVIKVEQNVIYLQQESDFSFEARAGR